jgi:hypothetical protein
MPYSKSDIDTHCRYNKPVAMTAFRARRVCYNVSDAFFDQSRLGIAKEDQKESRYDDSKECFLHASE